MTILHSPVDGGHTTELLESLSADVPTSSSTVDAMGAGGFLLIRGAEKLSMADWTEERDAWGDVDRLRLIGGMDS